MTASSGWKRISPLAQLERNTESTARQYDLVHRAQQLGWPREAIRVVDGDLGISGSVTGQRAGFEGMVAEVALGQVGIILALEASRLARDNAAWYRLLDLAGVCDTLVADVDAVYHPVIYVRQSTSGASTTELWSMLSRRISTITGSSGLCGTCFRPDTWKTGFGARRSAGHCWPGDSDAGARALRITLVLKRRVHRLASQLSSSGSWFHSGRLSVTMS